VKTFVVDRTNENQERTKGLLGLHIDSKAKSSHTERGQSSRCSSMTLRAQTPKNASFMTTLMAAQVLRIPRKCSICHICAVVVWVFFLAYFAPENSHNVRTRRLEFVRQMAKIWSTNCDFSQVLQFSTPVSISRPETLFFICTICRTSRCR
jgi:hypothetical protein